MYPNQPMVVYQNQPAPGTYYPHYPNQPQLIYSQNPVYSSQPYSPQLGTQVASQPAPGIQNYPHGTAMLNSCSSSATPSGHDSQTLFNLAQSIQQMNLGGAVPCQTTFMNNKGN